MTHLSVRVKLLKNLNFLQFPVLLNVLICQQKQQLRPTSDTFLLDVNNQGSCHLCSSAAVPAIRK